MNTQTGKSVGIALFLAAALLAALFAMGVFAPAGVDAGVYVGGDKAPTAELLDSSGKTVTTQTTDQNGLKLVIEFEVNDAVDGVRNGVAAQDNITINIPASVSGQTIPAFAEANVSVKQGDTDVGTVTYDASASITIAPHADNPLAADTRTIVTISDIDLDANSIIAEQTITITQQPSTATADAKYSVANIAAAPTNASAALSSTAGTLVIEFTARNVGAVVINPAVDYLLTASNVNATGIDSTVDLGTTGQISVTPAALTGTPPTTAVTVTIDSLHNLAAGDRITLSQNATGYSTTLDVGGATISPTTATADPTGCAGLNSCNADAAVSVELGGTAAAAMSGGSNFVITLPGFQIPSSIDRDEVTIDADYTVTTGTPPVVTGYFGEPADVDVGGTAAAPTITLRLPARQLDQNRTPVNIPAATAYTITFNKAAGIKNPNSAGTKTITVQDGDPVAGNHELDVVIVSHISVSNPKSGWVQRGDAVEVTAKGINAKGDATVHLHTAHTKDAIEELEEMLDDGDLSGEDLAALPALDRSPMDGGTAVLNFDTSSSIFSAQAVDATQDTSAAGTNVLIVVDAGGNVIGYKRLGLTPKVTLDLTEVRRTGRMKVTVSDWYYGGVSDLRVNGIQVGLPDPNNSDASIAWTEMASVANNVPFTVVVPRQARLGEMEVAVSGTTYVEQGTATSIDKHVQQVQVGVFDLTITESTAVTDQVIRIEGSGFGDSECIVEITVGDEHIREATTGDEIDIGRGADCVRTDTDGTLSNSFKVPHNLKPGDYTVVATDALNRVGEGLLTVPKPSITVTPVASQRGSTVTVVGENFPAEDVIGVTYDGDPVTVATTDTVGKWRATFKVPVDATIGKEYEVEALSEKKGTGQPRPVTNQQTVKLSAKGPHTVPAETLKVWPLGQVEPPDDAEEISKISSGGRLQVQSTNLPPHTKVSLFIGNIPVAGKVLGEDAAADSSGTYEDAVLVPQLTPGTHTVELDVDTVGADVVVVTFVDISEIITRPTEDVFEDLIAANQLTVVWKYDNDTATWASFDPTAPDELNDLMLVSTNDIVWVETTEGVEFQGGNLRAGWSLISLE